MKRFSFIAASFIFAAITAVSAFGQAAQPAAPFRMAVIDTGAFDTTGGITRYSTAMNALEAEFKPLETEIQGLVAKYNTLGAEIKKLQDQAAAGTVPIDQKTAAAKVEEYQTRADHQAKAGRCEGSCCASRAGSHGTDPSGDRQGAAGLRDSKRLRDDP